LAAGLRPNPLGELTALPRTPYLDSEGRGGMVGRDSRETRVGMGMGEEGWGRER